MSWKSTWETLFQNSTPMDKMDNMDKIPRGDESEENFPQAIQEPDPAAKATSREDGFYDYLLKSITSGGAYATLWPQARNYCRKKLSPAQFTQLEISYRFAPRGCDEPKPRQTDTRIKCKNCFHPDAANLVCKRDQCWWGLELLHDCPDFSRKGSPNNG